MAANRCAVGLTLVCWSLFSIPSFDCWFCSGALLPKENHTHGPRRCHAIIGTSADNERESLRVNRSGTGSPRRSTGPTPGVRTDQQAEHPGPRGSTSPARINVRCL